MTATLNKVQMLLQLPTETGHYKLGLNRARTEESVVIAALRDLQQYSGLSVRGKH